jgi:hypothetical protein
MFLEQPDFLNPAEVARLTQLAAVAGRSENGLDQPGADGSGRAESDAALVQILRSYPEALR